VTDGQTDGRNCDSICALSIYAVARNYEESYNQLYSVDGVCLTANQWLQFDIGPPTLVTGVVTRGRGDGRRKHWVTRFRLSYTNDTGAVWFYYKDANHLDAKVTAQMLCGS